MSEMGRMHDEAVEGIVSSFDAEEGWGVIESAQTPGGCFVHFSVIDMGGYRSLHAGQHVRFRFESLDFLQDGYRFRALLVKPRG